MYCKDARVDDILYNTKYPCTDTLDTLPCSVAAYLEDLENFIEAGGSVTVPTPPPCSDLEKICVQSLELLKRLEACTELMSVRI